MNTKLESWMQIQKGIGPRQEMVYRALSKQSMSNRELAEYLNIPINAITPRTNELCRMGKVARVGIKYDTTTNRNVTEWGAI